MASLVEHEIILLLPVDWKSLKKQIKRSASGSTKTLIVDANLLDLEPLDIETIAELVKKRSYGVTGIVLDYEKRDTLESIETQLTSLFDRLQEDVMKRRINTLTRFELYLPDSMPLITRISDPLIALLKSPRLELQRFGMGFYLNRALATSLYQTLNSIYTLDTIVVRNVYGDKTATSFNLILRVCKNPLSALRTLELHNMSFTEASSRNFSESVAHLQSKVSSIALKDGVSFNRSAQAIANFSPVIYRLEHFDIAAIADDYESSVLLVYLIQQYKNGRLYAKNFLDFFNLIKIDALFRVVNYHALSIKCETCGIMLETSDTSELYEDHTFRCEAHAQF